QEDDKPLPTVAAWHGTLLPKTDGDIWLASAFANYEKIVALENALRQQREAENKELTEEDRDRLALELFAHRANYLAGARASSDVPLAKTRSDVARNDWYRVASGKGVLFLHELRRLLGRGPFEKMMDSFGREQAGKEISSEQFQAHA